MAIADTKQKLARVAAGIVGAVFLVSAYLKSIDPAETAAALEHALGAVHPGLVTPSLYVLIFGEIALGAALIAGIALRLASALAAAALVVFTAWLAYLLISGVELACGCGRVSSGLLIESVGRNMALTMSVLGNLVLCSLSAFSALHAVKHAADGDLAFAHWSQERGDSTSKSQPAATCYVPR